jgi:omega-3 fatty acid desaturase (delta-15 desaturase)
MQHGHVENDESWHPTNATNYGKMDKWGKLGRLLFPFPLFAYPFYLWNRSPGKNGSHFDPKSDLFTESEGPQVETSNKFQCAWLGFLAGCTVALGPLAMLNLYVLPCEPFNAAAGLPFSLQCCWHQGRQGRDVLVTAAVPCASSGPPSHLSPSPSLIPDWMFVVWLDVVTYLHHHGPSDPEEEVPWYRGEQWSYFRGGLSTIDRDCE